MREQIEQLDFPFNLLYRIKLGEMEVKNNELIQNIIIKKTILGIIFEKLFGKKNERTN